MWRARRNRSRKTCREGLWSLRVCLRPFFAESPRGRAGLIFKDEAELDVAQLDGVTVVEAGGAVNGLAIYCGHFIGGADIVAVVAFVDLRGDFGGEPAFQADGGHLRLADHGEFVG